MISFTSNAKKLSSRYHNRMFALTDSIALAEAESAAEIKAEAQRLSSGPFSTAYLRAAARRRGRGLYSRVAPAPPGPAGVINEQSGRLKRSWVCRVYIVKDGTRITLYNTSPEGKYMQGTSRMIPRPIQQMVANRMRAQRVLRLAQAKHRALRVS